MLLLLLLSGFAFADEIATNSGVRPVAHCPDDMAALPGFCIDRYEAPNEKGTRPFTARGADEAEAWCNERGKRLCTQKEWIRSCGGARKNRYPYGNVYKRGVCNDDKPYRAVNWGLVNKFPSEAARRHIDELNQSDPSGSRPGCVSDDGVYDLAGNASEWVLRTGKITSGYGYGMMGCYWSGCYNMHKAAGIKAGCEGTLNAGHPGPAKLFRTYEAGFRCCATLAP
ncbi:MAG: SUMF1/EgtB/PvdO family nonheme iron enzyme [Deltaproteobacteria bacterium]|nr:SUMF1/EgtB/PvdO family nonheme iron enzyme [Deltaproteobacteria bacterium]